MSNQTVQRFVEQWNNHWQTRQNSLSTVDGDWIVKGFIDIYQNIYTIAPDTKVISKLVEIMLFPAIAEFATQFDYKLVPSSHQNHYPDITFVAKDDTKIAFDLKSTYRVSASRVNGFTLGAFTGYFRDRTSTKNITFPYQDYSAHYVFGVIYSRSDTAEEGVYKLDELTSIASVVNNFEYIFHEKWQIASDRPGSGNTKNIGSVTDIEALQSGDGKFADHGKAIFDDYWMNYLTTDMARLIDSTVPYRNLPEYFAWKSTP